MENVDRAILEERHATLVAKREEAMSPEREVLTRRIIKVEMALIHLNNATIAASYE